VRRLGGRKAVVAALDDFLANRKNKGIAIATIRKYETFIKQFRAYSEHYL